MASCPVPTHGKGRGDLKPSLSVRADGDRLLVKCHAGCDTISVLKAIGLEWEDIVGAREKSNPQRPAKIVATYDYRDSTGQMLFQVVRLDPKNFRQRRPHPTISTEWLWDLRGCQRVLYRLPEIIEAVKNGRTVFLVEGEKDADSLAALGLDATTNSGGAGKWRTEYSETLRGANVVIIPDADAPGQTHAEKVARTITGIAAKVRVVSLPGAGKDVSDWIAAGGTREQLEVLVSATPASTFEAPLDKPIIYANTGDLATVTHAAWTAIERANCKPFVFRRGGRIVRIGADDDGRPLFEELTVDRLRHLAAREARWRKHEKRTGDEIDARPPIDVIKDMLATPSERIPLPVVTRITDVPVCDSAGKICDLRGYNPGNKTYYVPVPGLTIPPVTIAPTEEAVRKARDTVIDPFLDFPFKDEADLTHIVAMTILPFCRNMIIGPTPLHAITATVPGTGKTKAAEVALYPATGGCYGIVSSSSEEELRKRILTELMRGRTAILFDNINRLDSSLLSAVLTQVTWTDRILGRNEEISVPNMAVYALTGNNPILSVEIARRCIRTHLDPNMERPWERKGFRYPNLSEWLAKNRGQLIGAIQVLIQAWVNDGKPLWKGRALGSFESWSGVIGGILNRAGIGHFLENSDELYESCSLESAVWREITNSWWSANKSMEVGTSDLFPLAEKVVALDLGRGSERSQKTIFGKKLAAMKDRVVGDYRITRSRQSNGATLWRLLPVKGIGAE